MKPIARYLLLGSIAENSLRRELIIADTAKRRLLRLALLTDTEMTIPSYLDLENVAATPDTDPARPEQIKATSMRRISRPPKPRLVTSILEDLSQTEELVPLFIPGPSVAYSRFDASFPSVVSLRLHDPILEPQLDGTLLLSILWRERRHHLPLTKELASHFDVNTTVAGRRWKLVREGIPNYAIAAYSAPHEGYCKKWIVAVY
ncbi:MAG: hypothetical protein ACYCWN_11940 [Ferrimicrobium sp.]|jgi:hypothetical protein|uniref:Transcriptional regulator, AbiEi antitoxin, Type IV TA system n=1 Tax=Ferrimicrobium acidiphilum TaxID=121039 RepID=A0ABV3XZD2_9ACTN|nr:hypothetical protein [Ferrimicrobium sp.]MCL5974036.1 hypothetical protein [Actinomycetota bacterium]